MLKVVTSHFGTFQGSFRKMNFILNHLKENSEKNQFCFTKSGNWQQSTIEDSHKNINYQMYASHTLLNKSLNEKYVFICFIFHPSRSFNQIKLSFLFSFSKLRTSFLFFLTFLMRCIKLLCLKSKINYYIIHSNIL